MKVAVTADTHLEDRGDYPERYTALGNILEQMRSDNMETLIIAGDLFDKDSRNHKDFEKLCQKYPDIDCHIIPGNHDIGISEKSIVGGNIHVYTDPTTMEIDSTTFLLIPYQNKVTMGDTVASMAQNVEGKEWVLVGHGDYYGGTKELNPLEPGTYMPLTKAIVQKYGPRVVLLGHIHKPTNWKQVYYTGSPCGLDINETGKHRFLVYDTSDHSVTTREVVTDIIFFNESFFIVPTGDEVAILNHEIGKRIESWGINPSDYKKVCMRVRALGYSADRSAILSVIQDGFSSFKYYHDEGPNIDSLSLSNDLQLNAIAEQTMKVIDELEWENGSDEPSTDHIKLEALKVIYGD
jgi:DNA repair protein SbcD/Mre11